jgi:hypothetical protein
MNALKNFLASQAFHSFYHAALAGATGFLATNGFAPSKAWVCGLGAAVLGGVIGWLNGNGPTPSSPAPQPPKAAMILLLLGALFALSGSANAQTTEQTGWGINPSFAAPLQFGENASGNWIALPSFGLAADVGWKDIITTNGQMSIKKSLGLFFEGNISQAEPGTPSSLVNGVVGLEEGYNGINMMEGYQAIGDPLTGPGGSRILISVSYAVDQLLGNWLFFK